MSRRVARPARKDERDQGDEAERGDDPAEPAPPLALGIEPCLPEDEHRDQGQERKPIGLCIPQEAPEQAPVAVHELAQPERSVDPENETDEVEDDERGNARCTPEGAAQREVRARRADVAERLGVAALVPAAAGAADDGGSAGGAFSVATGGFMIGPQRQSLRVIWACA